MTNGQMVCIARKDKLCVITKGEINLNREISENRSFVVD